MMKISEADEGGFGMKFQVVENITKALLSVSKVCEQGHDVVFSKKKGDYILVGGETNNIIPLRQVGGTYELDVWLKPADRSSADALGFTRPGGAR